MLLWHHYINVAINKASVLKGPHKPPVFFIYSKTSTLSNTLGHLSCRRHGEDSVSWNRWRESQRKAFTNDRIHHLKDGVIKRHLGHLNVEDKHSNSSQWRM